MITKLGRIMGTDFGAAQRRASYLGDDSASHMVQRSAESKSQEDKSSWGRAIGTGAAAGAGGGALAGRVAGKSPRQALLGAGIGAAAGGLLGAGEKKYDAIQKEDAEQAKSESRDERARRLMNLRLAERRNNQITEARRKFTGI